MYPIIRMALGLWGARRLPPLGLGDAHVSHHVIWPWDLDVMLELNNGRTLTLYDLGRLPLAQRMGLLGLIRKRRWGLTMAGAAVRYRQRIRAFERVEMRSRVIGWDARFVYIEQGLWRRDGVCAGHVVYRSAVTSAQGLVPTATLAEALGLPSVSPPLPAWVAAWLAAEAHRPWPPMADPVPDPAPEPDPVSACGPMPAPDPAPVSDPVSGSDAVPANRPVAR